MIRIELLGNSLVVKWLGLLLSLLRTWVPFLVGELRSHRLLGMAKKERGNEPSENGFLEYFQMLIGLNITNLSRKKKSAKPNQTYTKIKYVLVLSC